MTLIGSMVDRILGIVADFLKPAPVPIPVRVEERRPRR